jgi:hypothetical protein
MEVGSAIRIYNDALGVKGAKGRLLHIKKEGYYAVTLEVKDKMHQAYLPIGGTVILAAEAIAEVETVPVDRY